MLPIPFKLYIPKLLSQNLPSDEGGQALVEKVDIHLIEWLTELRDLRWLHDPLRCPAVVLDVLGAMISANIKSYDTERIKRKKIATAVAGHKKRGTWQYDIKTKIDAITGTDSELIRNLDSGVWVVMCQEIDDPSYYWGVVRAEDGTPEDENAGLIIEDETMNLLTLGIIYINTKMDGSPESEAIIDKVKVEIQDDFTPAYMKIILGYHNGSAFVPYPNGEI